MIARFLAGSAGAQQKNIETPEFEVTAGEVVTAILTVDIDRLSQSQFGQSRKLRGRAGSWRWKIAVSRLRCAKKNSLWQRSVQTWSDVSHRGRNLTKKAQHPSRARRQRARA
jgi:hypothetical protein